MTYCASSTQPYFGNVPIPMSIDTTLRVCVPSSVIIQLIGEQSILLNLQTNMYYGLDPIGTRMIQVLNEVLIVGHAAEILLSEFEVSQDILQHDIAQLVQDLLEQGLLRELTNSP